MDFKNVIMAIVLSTVVLIAWATFFEAPVVEQQTVESEITKNEDISSPSIDEDKKEKKLNGIKKCIIGNYTFNNSSCCLGNIF